MKASIITTIIFTLLLFPIAAAEVVVFEKYDTTMHLEGGKLLVTKDLRLKNTGDNPIIPGEIHFKISKEEKGKTLPPTIEQFTVINKFGKSLDTRTVATEKEVDLVFTVWDPLLPDFYYDMKMTYEIEFKPGGILFFQVALPEERTTIPITHSVTNFEIPKKYHITYAPGAEVSSDEKNAIASWNEKNTYTVEYSVIPFPRTGVKASNVFWVVIILLFLINLIVRLRKKNNVAQKL